MSSRPGVTPDVGSPDSSGRIRRMVPLIPANIAAILMIFITLVVFLNVFGRYLFELSLQSLNDIVLLCACWVAFLGAADGIRQNYHVAIDFVVSRLPVRIQGVIELLTGVMVTFGLGTLAVLGYNYMFNATALLQALHISMRPLIASVPVGLTLMTYWTAKHLLGVLRQLRAGTFAPTVYVPEESLEGGHELSSAEEDFARRYGVDVSRGKEA